MSLNTPMRTPEELASAAEQANDIFGGTEDALLLEVDPEDAAKLATEVASIRGSEPQAPELPEPGDHQVDLLVGVNHPDRGFLREACVRELNGEDEEHIYRAKTNAEWMNAIVQRGVFDIGGHSLDEAALDNLTFGDRDLLVIAVRRATYGDEVEMDITCRQCETAQEIVIDLATEVENRNFSGPLDVELRNGGVATLRWPLVRDEREIERQRSGDDNVGTQNSLVLSKVLLSVDGEPSRGLATTKSLNMRDRRRIIEFIATSAPRPLLDEVEHTCVRCGRVAPLNLGFEALFR